MSLTLSEIKQILTERQLRPLKQFGQNFLFDANTCRVIVESLPAPKNAEIVEIGPGMGSLTRILLEKNFFVTAVELDRGLRQYLKDTLKNHERFKLIEGDILEELPKLPPPKWLIGNLPYNISTPLLVEILKLASLPQACVLTLQKEVGERVSAAPKTKEYGAVSVFAQNFYEIELLKNLKRHLFYPEPNVDSVVLRMTKKNLRSAADQRADFYRFLKLGFSHRRKMLRKVLPVENDARAEELSPEEWKKLYDELRGNF